MTLNNFHYAMTLMEQLYGITIQEDQFEEIALVAWNLIGNKRYKLYRYSTCAQGCTTEVQLPCNCDYIEAVTTSWEDWESTSNLYPNGDINSAHVEEYIESRKQFKNPLYQRGKFVKYERVGDTLYLSEPYGQINILYKGVVLDDDGLPELTDKEANAIATYCAYVTKFKEGLMTNNSNIISVANLLKQQWNVQCDQARVTDYLNQNEMDQILEAKTNWNRKIHNKSYKPIQ